MPSSTSAPTPTTRARFALRVVHGCAFLLVAAHVLSSAAPAAGQPTAAAAFENVTIVIGGYQAYARFTGGEERGGELDGPSAMIEAELWRNDERIARDRQVAGPAGDVSLSFRTTGAGPRAPVPIREGDAVRMLTVHPEREEAEAPDSATTWTAGRISARIEQDGTVRGTAPAGRRVNVTGADTVGGFGGGSTTADEDGRWSVTLGGRLVPGPGMTGTALYQEDGVVHQAGWAWSRTDVRVGSSVVELVERAGIAVIVEQRPSEALHGPAIGRGEAVVWRGGGERTALLLRDAQGRPSPVRPGDRLTVIRPPLDAFDRAIAGSESGDAPSMVEIEATSVGVDIQTQEVTGTVRAAARLRVRALGRDVLVDAEPGEPWRASFRDFGRLAVDTAVTVDRPDATWSITARPRSFGVLDARDAAFAGRGTAGDHVSLRLVEPLGDENPASAPIAPVDGYVGPDGEFRLDLWDPEGNPVPLDTDSRLGLTLAGHAIEVPAPPVRARARASRNRVRGEAAPHSVVTVIVDPRDGDVGAVEQRIVGSDGTWMVELDGRVDLVPGRRVRVRVWPPAGLPAELNFPVFRVSAQSDGDRVRLEGWPDLSGETWLERNGRVIARGFCRVVRESCDAVWVSVDGAATGAQGDVGASMLRPTEGDELRVYPDQEAAVTLGLVKFAAHIDLSGADVVGASPPQEPVEITFRHDDGGPIPLEARVGADDNGVFDYELAASQWDLVTPGLIADVYHPRPGGHRLFATGVMEDVRAWPGSGRVTGVAEPGTRIVASLHAFAPVSVPLPSEPMSTASMIGPAVARGEALADGLARFDIRMRDARGKDVAAEPGATLVVTHARRTLVVPITHIAAWPNNGAGDLAGATAPQHVVRAIHTMSLAGDEVEAEIVRSEGESDLAGTFVLAAPLLNPVLRATLELSVLLPGGGQLRRSIDARSRPGVLWLPHGAVGR